MNNRYSIHGLIFELHKRTPLAVKMVAITIFVGFGVWFLLDYYQSRSAVDVLTNALLLEERRNRAIAAPIFIGCFILIMLWITRRIQNLTIRIADFSKHNLGVSMRVQRKGDQLIILEESFQKLTDEILVSHEKLKKEAEEKSILEKKSLMMEQKEKQLELLQSVTDTLHVGIMIEGPNDLEAANNQMEHLMEICGGDASFRIEQGNIEERSVLDNRGLSHIFEVSSHNIFDEKIILVRDITELKAHTELLEHMALHDPLTGLPNRTLFYDRMEHAIYSAQRDDRMFAMLMMDLDGFKLINDTLGHHIGDLVLQEVAKRMMEMLRKADTVARLGGDEFGILLLSIDGIDDSIEVASKLLNELRKPMLLDGESLKVGGSIGIALYPDHGNSTDMIVRNADISMYAAKKSGQGISTYSIS